MENIGQHESNILESVKPDVGLTEGEVLTIRMVRRLMASEILPRGQEGKAINQDPSVQLTDPK